MASNSARGIEGRCKVDISEWQDSRPAIVPRKVKSRDFLVPNIVAVLLTFVVHGIAMTSILYGSPNSGSRERARNAGAGRLWIVPEPLTLIELHASQEVRVALDNVLTAALTKIEIMPAIELDPPTFDHTEQAASTDSPSTDPAPSVSATEREQLLSIYIRQIKARIERVWRRPRTPVADGMLASLRLKDDPFECELHITQDTHGGVEDVLLDKCNGSLEWQQSLVTAIREASPLPGPPNAEIFNSSIGLTFNARAYRAGALADQYEAQQDHLFNAK